MSSEVRGLGRGLGALLGAELSVSPAEAPHFALSLMRPGAFQPRRDILKEPLEELAASIKANGVLQPIVIRALRRASATGCATKSSPASAAGRRRSLPG